MKAIKIVNRIKKKNSVIIAVLIAEFIIYEQ